MQIASLPPVVFFVVDIESGGVDFMLWGDSLDAAQVTFDEMTAQGYAVEVRSYLCDEVPADLLRLIGIETPADADDIDF